ncbi:hypothetical protein [Clostridium tagluense]|uniref:hypothetical protein n=1 Tax=Clostridium tagluense TaxID=360422 RepID=UPI001CF21DA2|nr:hypothetical protein [Clostridium tagluense]MCB2300431.1 hypothetical protein [Clostridium tagluense]
MYNYHCCKIDKYSYSIISPNELKVVLNGALKENDMVSAIFQQYPKKDTGAIVINKI